MLDSEDVLFYLKNSRDVESVATSLNQVLKMTNIDLDRNELKQIIKSRDAYLREHKMVDVLYHNLVKSVELAIPYETSRKKELIVLSLDIMEIFYYVRLANPITWSDKEVMEHIEQKLVVYEGDIESLRGYYENHPVLDGGEI